MSEISIIIVALTFSAFFTGLEIAFMAMNRLRLEIEKKQKRFSSFIVSIFTHNSEHFTATMMVGNIISFVVFGIESMHFSNEYFSTHIDSTLIILLLQILIISIFLILIGEFIPRILFRINPNGILNFFALPTLFFYVVLYPVTLITFKISTALIQLFLRKDIKSIEGKNIFTKHELNELVFEAENEKSNKEDLKHDLQIFNNALHFSELKLRECMMPRNDIVSVDLNDSIRELTEKFISSGFSKILVYKESIDNIIGYFNVKDLFEEPKNIGEKMRELIIVPETMPASKLLQTFTKENKGIALIVDEFGGTAGLVTIEDIIEEIIGDINDEHDFEDFVEKKLSDKEYIFSGRLEIDYLNETYGFHLPESDEYETLAGYIISIYENIPEKREKIITEKYTFVITERSQTKIELLKMTIH